MEKLIMRLPPGFRFHPTDEELVVEYLKKKAMSCPLPAAIISDIDFRSRDPWDLPGCHDGERYFFNLQEANYRKSGRSNIRATMSGYWKATGREKTILCSKLNEIVGMKKVLVFHQGKPPHGVRTHWVMHEYRLAGPDQTKNPSQQYSLVQGQNWVVSRIFMKKKGTSKMKENTVQCYSNSRAGDDRNNHGDFGPQSPPSSCVTDLSDEEEGSKGEEANSK
ncbi:NAC domain-containing protein 83-like isoform X2 [Asparagus officinalis]|uniref:NAC domain-containing protein 83-like isoform X2 n=1 Tax=Asparagus officinalis TaxID=4686 RepID=UPI00098DE25D|nr:NAC domain-containing protein 83-like isoform X2 [Asparagus officinalis]